MKDTSRTNINASVPVDLVSELRIRAAERARDEGKFIGMSKLVEEALRQYLGTAGQ